MKETSWRADLVAKIAQNFEIFHHDEDDKMSVDVDEQEEFFELFLSEDEDDDNGEGAKKDTKSFQCQTKSMEQSQLEKDEEDSRVPPKVRLKRRLKRESNNQAKDGLNDSKKRQKTFNVLYEYLGPAWIENQDRTICNCDTHFLSSSSATEIHTATLIRRKLLIKNYEKLTTRFLFLFTAKLKNFTRKIKSE